MSKKDLIRQIIREELINLGGEQFQLSPDDVDQLKKHLDVGMGKKPFKPMSRSGKGDKRKIDAPFAQDSDWKSWMKKLGYPEDWEGGEAPEGVLIDPKKMQKLYFTLYDITSSTFSTKYIDNILDAIYSADPAALGSDLFSLDSTSPQIPVPPSMQGLADINTAKGGNKGTETGRGEFVVPFLFRDGSMGGSNAVHDVTIGGEGWHVKEVPNANDGIRLGMNSYANSPLSSTLQSEVGMSGKELAVGGRKGTNPANSAMDNLEKSHKPGKKSIMEVMGASTKSEALQILQDKLDEDMRDLGIGDGAGVLFYVPSEQMMYFTPTEECVCVAASQGAHKVSRRPMGPFAEKAQSMNESLIRAYMRSVL